MEFLTFDKIIEQEEKDSKFRVKQIFEKRKKINIEKDRQKLLAVILDGLKRYGNIVIEAGNLPGVGRSDRMSAKGKKEVVPGIVVSFFVPSDHRMILPSLKYYFEIQTYFSNKRFLFDEITLQQLELTVEQMIHEARLVQYLLDHGFEGTVPFKTLTKEVNFERQFTHEVSAKIYGSQILDFLIVKLIKHPLIKSVNLNDKGHLHVTFKNQEHQPLVLRLDHSLVDFDYQGKYYGNQGKEIFHLQGEYNNPALPMLNLMVEQIIAEVENDLQSRLIPNVELSVNQSLSETVENSLLWDNLGTFNLIQLLGKIIRRHCPAKQKIVHELIKRGSFVDPIWSPMIFRSMNLNEPSWDIFYDLDKYPGMDFSTMESLKVLFFKLSDITPYFSNSPDRQKGYLERLMDLIPPDSPKDFETVLQLYSGSSTETFSHCFPVLTRFLNGTVKGQEIMENKRVSDLLVSRFGERILQRINQDTLKSQVLSSEIVGTIDFNIANWNLMPEAFMDFIIPMEQYLTFCPAGVEAQLAEKFKQAKYEQYVKSLVETMRHNFYDLPFWSNCFVDYENVEQIPMVINLQTVVNNIPEELRALRERIYDILVNIKQIFDVLKAVALSNEPFKEEHQKALAEIDSRIIFNSGLSKRLSDQLPEMWSETLPVSQLDHFEVIRVRQEEYQRQIQNRQIDFVHIINALELFKTKVNLNALYNFDQESEDVLYTKAVEKAFSFFDSRDDFSQMDKDNFRFPIQIEDIQKIMEYFKDLDSKYFKEQKLLGLFCNYLYRIEPQISEITPWLVLIDQINAYRLQLSDDWKQGFFRKVIDELNVLVNQEIYQDKVDRLQNIIKPQSGEMPVEDANSEKEFRDLVADVRQFSELIEKRDGLLMVLGAWKKFPVVLTADARQMIFSAWLNFPLDQEFAEKAGWLSMESSFISEISAIKILLQVIDKFPEVAKKYSLLSKIKLNCNSEEFKLALVKSQDMTLVQDLFVFIESPEYAQSILDNQAIMLQAERPFCEFVFTFLIPEQENEHTLDYFLKKQLYIPNILRELLADQNQLANLNPDKLVDYIRGMDFSGFSETELEELADKILAKVYRKSHVNIKYFRNNLSELMQSEGGRKLLLRLIGTTQKNIQHSEILSPDWMPVIYDARYVAVEDFEQLMIEAFGQEKAMPILRPFITSRKIFDRLEGLGKNEKSTADVYWLCVSYLRSLNIEIKLIEKKGVYFDISVYRRKIEEYAQRVLCFFNGESRFNIWENLSLEQIETIFSAYLRLLDSDKGFHPFDVGQHLRKLQLEFFEEMRRTKDSQKHDGLLALVSLLESKLL